MYWAHTKYFTHMHSWLLTTTLSIIDGYYPPFIEGETRIYTRPRPSKSKKPCSKCSKCGSCRLSPSHKGQVRVDWEKTVLHAGSQEVWQEHQLWVRAFREAEREPHYGTWNTAYSYNLYLYIYHVKFIQSFSRFHFIWCLWSSREVSKGEIMISSLQPRKLRPRAWHPRKCQKLLCVSRAPFSLRDAILKLHHLLKY